MIFGHAFSHGLGVLSQFGSNVGKFAISHPSLITKGAELLANQDIPSLINFAEEGVSEYRKNVDKQNQAEDEQAGSFEDLYNQVYPEGSTGYVSRENAYQEHNDHFQMD